MRGIINCSTCFLFLSILMTIELNHVNGQRTYLDSKFLPLYRATREFIFGMVGPTSRKRVLQNQIKIGKVQPQFSPLDKFFCDVNGPGSRSPIPPTSVHKIRPGDIDIVGAMGDSLTAGNGALANNIVEVLIENKGVSFMGGQANWRKFLTLANILKEFNPNLYGYSLADGYSVHNSARFNVAEIGAMSRDIPHEAKELVKRMKNDVNVDIKNHWKFITLMVGPNDFCSDICYMQTPEKAVDNHEKDLLKTIRYIRDNLPRTILNLIVAPSMNVLLRLSNKPLQCVTGHVIECPCMFATRFLNERNRYLKIMEKWQNIEIDVANREEFHKKDDFTVNIIPFLKRFHFPEFKNGITDYSYMSADCFHVSQKSYSRASNAIWNNIMEPFNNKTEYWPKEFTIFKCPTEQSPYIFTKLNS